MELHVRLKMKYAIVETVYVNAKPRNRVEINLGLLLATF